LSKAPFWFDEERVSLDDAGHKCAVETYVFHLSIWAERKEHLGCQQRMTCGCDFQVDVTTPRNAHDAIVGR